MKVVKRYEEEGKGDLVVTMELVDECKNGHEDFSITVTNYQTGSSGCIHEDIVERVPKLKFLVDLHLSDFKGVPMYAVANGFYYLKEARKDKDYTQFKKYLRLTDAEVKLFKEKGYDELMFKYIIEQGILQRWYAEALYAIVWLETESQQTFKAFGKSHYTPLTKEELILLVKRIGEDYYSPKQEKLRQQKLKKEQKLALLQRQKDRFASESDHLKIDNALKVALIQSNLSTSSAIYYSHSDKIAFNWGSVPTTKATFESFCKKVKSYKYLKNVQMSLGLKDAK